MMYNFEILSVLHLFLSSNVNMLPPNERKYYEYKPTGTL